MAYKTKATQAAYYKKWLKRNRHYHRDWWRKRRARWARMFFEA